MADHQVVSSRFGSRSGPSTPPHHQVVSLSPLSPVHPPSAFDAPTWAGTFITKIFHPNVNPTTGEVCPSTPAQPNSFRSSSLSFQICVNTLKKDWKPEFGISHILLVVKWCAPRLPSRLESTTDPSGLPASSSTQIPTRPFTPKPADSCTTLSTTTPPARAS